MTLWEEFYREKCVEMFTSSKEVIDIGGALRMDLGKSNVVSKENQWLLQYVEKVDYRVPNTTLLLYSVDTWTPCFMLKKTINRWLAIICG